MTGETGSRVRTQVCTEGGESAYARSLCEASDVNG